MEAVKAVPVQRIVSKFPRDRSRIVCQRCHTRKVKCDLLSRLNSYGSCSNCDKRSEACQIRGNQRLNTTSSRLQTQSNFSTLPLNNAGAVRTRPTVPSLIDSIRTPSNLERNDRQSTTMQTPGHSASAEEGYVGESSVMSRQPIPLSTEACSIFGCFPTSVREQILAATKADQLPSRSMIDASVVAYFKYLYHRMPVLDRQDVTLPCGSAILLLSICLAASVLRHPKPTSLQDTAQLYLKVKTLFFIDHEQAPLTTLKAICLITLWNVRSPSEVTFDCSWNWLGVAIRFALQMGLHREATHSQGSMPACARRVAWFLYAQDKMHAACFGRPLMLRPEDFDLRPLSTADFEEAENDQGRVFILFANLSTTYAKILKLQPEKLATASEEVLSILSDLSNWIHSIPSDLRIFDDQDNQIYHREMYEILIAYFTCIITYFHIYGRLFQSSLGSRMSLVASSCIISLYQEMDCRDDINYLMAINNWFMMTASLPQLNNISREAQCGLAAGNAVASGPSSLEEVESLLGILRQRTLKFPGAEAIVRKIERSKSEVLSQHHRSLSLDGTSTRYPATPISTSYEIVSRLHELFPFSKALTPRIELIHAMLTENFIDDLLPNYFDWALHDVLSMEDFSSIF